MRNMIVRQALMPLSYAVFIRKRVPNNTQSSLLPSQECHDVIRVAHKCAKLGMQSNCESSRQTG